MIESVTALLENGFMQRAGAALVILCLGSSPLGAFMLLRRMSLLGDGLSHAILPGIALSYAMVGLSVPMMMLSGLGAGLIVTLAATALARYTALKEDAAFNALFVSALALGILLLTRHGSAVDLYHIMFGNILAIDKTMLLVMAGANTFILGIIAVFYRSFVLECVDPLYARQHLHFAYLQYALLYILIMVSLVTSFQATGTLMTLGVLLLPAASARLWGRTVDQIMVLTVVFSTLGSLVGLILSYALDTPTSVTIVLLFAVLLTISALFGLHGGILPKLFPGKHLEH